MPTIDFTSGYRDATQGSTLKALAARRAEMAANLAARKTPQINDPWQGAAEVANTISGSIREGRLASQEAAGRQRFAQLLSGGLAPDEIGEAMGLDPETTQMYVKNDWDVKAAADRVKAEQAQQAALFGQQDKTQTALFGHEDAAKAAEYGHQDTTAAKLAGTQEAAAVADDTRAAAEKRLEEQTAATTATKLAETQAAQAADTAAMADPAARVKLAMRAGYLTEAEGNAQLDAITLKTRLAAQTEGSKKRDVDFVKDANDWDMGGKDVAAKNLMQIDEAMKLLNEPGTLSSVPVIGGGLQAASDWLGLGKSGAGTSMIPEEYQTTFNEKGVIARDSLRAAVQDSLKAVLGTQYTEAEGKDLMNRAFSMAVNPQENARRAQLIRNQIEAAAKAKQAMVDWYNTHNQTLEGYVGERFDPAKLKSDIAAVGDGAGGGGGGGGAQPAPAATDTGAAPTSSEPESIDDILKRNQGP